MNKITIIFLVFLIGSALSLKMKKLPAAKNNTTNLAQMLVKLKQGGTDEVVTPKTLQGFLDELHGMIDQLQTDQNDHYEVFVNMTQQCSDEASFRADEIADANDALVRAKASRNECQTSLDDSSVTLDQVKLDKLDFEADLDDATNVRDAQHREYLRYDGYLDEGLQFVNDFLAHFNTENGRHFANGFAQVAENLMMKVNKLGKTKEAMPVFVALAQFDMNAANDYSVDGRATNPKHEELRNALNDLIDRLTQDQFDRNAVETSQLNAYLALKARLEQAITDSADQITALNDQILEMTSCVSDENAIIDEADAKLLNNRNLKDQAANMCDTFEKEFYHATYTRNQEINTVYEILVIVNEHFDQVAEDLVQYLEDVKDGFLVREEYFIHEKYEEYVKQILADNDRGRELRDTPVTDEDYHSNWLDWKVEVGQM